jgi:UDP-2,3-diacylglucosamine pyrophosphatase LpxH
VTGLANVHNYRTIWISDLHLGTRGCKAEFLLDFFRDTEAETIYLVGDIIDGWRLKKS